MDLLQMVFVRGEASRKQEGPKIEDMSIFVEDESLGIRIVYEGTEYIHDESYRHVTPGRIYGDPGPDGHVIEGDENRA